MIAVRKKYRWCKQCQNYGHTKWLYLKVKIRRLSRRIKKLKKMEAE